MSFSWKLVLTIFFCFVTRVIAYFEYHEINNDLGSDAVLGLWSFPPAITSWVIFNFKSHLNDR